MSVTFTATQAGGASADYMKYVYNGLSKDDRTNDPKLLDFGLVPWDASFVKLKRGAYITLTNSTYGTWYTGFITNDPELQYFGTKNGLPVHGFIYEATSDVYLLNLKNIGIVPPFINTDQGTILKYLVNFLTPAGYTFDVTAIGAGQKIPRYVIDPSKKFSDVVKEFADAANYRFWDVNMALHFVQRDSVACTITVDGNSKHFTPSNLKLQPTSDSITNDVVVTGASEPQNYITEYFVGDGYTGVIPTMSSVYGADSSKLLDEDFSASQTDLTKWSVFDKPTNFLQVSNGFLNVLGGSNNGSLDVYYQSANLIPLEGNLRITHGEYDFVNSASRGLNGIISGLWTGTPTFVDNQTFTGCVYGLRVFSQTNMVPDSDILNGANWADTSSGAITIVNGSGAVRGNCFRYVGTGSASANLYRQSIAITVVPGSTYTLSGYIDARFVTTSGSLIWGVYKADLSAAIAGTPNQTAGVSSRLSITFTVPVGVTSVVVLANMNGTVVTSGQPLSWSDPQLELGSTATIYETNNTGALDTRLMPIVNGTLDRTQWTVIDFSKRYILRTVLAHQNIHRQLRQYSYMANGGVVGYYGGGSSTDSQVLQTFITEIDPTTAAITNQWVWTNTSSLSTAQTYGYYCPVVSNDLHCTVTGITVSVPLQMTLAIQKKGSSGFVRQIVGQNEIDSFDGLTPAATVVSQNTGATTKSSLLGTSQYNSSQATLQFFHDTTKQTSQIPQPGDQVYFRYRRPGAAIARVQDKNSVTSEATAWGDNGIRALTKSDLSPQPRNSAECEFAAASIVQYTNYQHYQGSYTMENAPFISGVFSGEPLSGTVLHFQNLPSQFPSYLQAEIVNQVRTTFDHSVGGECFTHEISFGSVDPSHAAVARLRRVDDVFQPQDSIELPFYIDVSSVGNTFVGDVLAPTLVSVDASNLNFNTNQAPPTGGGFEVRYTDESWGADNGKNLVTRTSSQTFSVARNQRGKVCFVKAYDARNRVPYSEDFTHWSQGTGTSTTNSADKNPDGFVTQISKILFTGTTSFVIYAPEAAQANKQYVYGVWLKGSAPDIGKSVTIELGDSGNWGVAGYFASTAVVLNGKWQYVQTSLTMGATPTSSIQITVSRYGASDNPCTVQATRASLEVGTLSPTVYCKTNGTAYGAMSRFASGLKVGYPLIPPAPTAAVDITNPLFPAVNVTLPAALTDVWGVEIRDSDNVSVLYHKDLTDSSFLTSLVYNNSLHFRSLSFYVYTYNLLGEYSPTYNATATIPTPAITGLTVDDAGKALTWTNSAQNFSYINVLIDATDATMTHPVAGFAVGGQDNALALTDPHYFNQRWFKLTPVDALGTGTPSSVLSHVYTPTGVVEFNGNEVAVVPSPASPTTDPTVPSALSDFPKHVINRGWNNYKLNLDRYQ